VYTTVGWEENVAALHPEWRQVRKDGSFANCSPGADPGARQQAPWKFMDFANPDYQDYVAAHLDEVLSRYDVDGFFVDIVFLAGEASWSDACRKLRAELSLEADTPQNHVLVESEAQRRFAERFTRQIHARVPDASVFYNAPNNMYVTGGDGVLRRAAFQTHFEIESLPSGIWGYFHFPRLARRLDRKGKPWVGMTGKFQKMWGDFGGLKPQAALEYECFRSQALGGGNSVGDQLHPRGVLDEETYLLIGSVFAQTEAAEPFYRGSVAWPQIGVLSPNHPALREDETAKSEEGAVLALEELHYDCAVLDDASPLDPYELVVLPDSVVVTDALRAKLEARLAQGGKLLLTGRSGFAPDGQWALPSLPLRHEGEVAAYPTYWRTTARLDPAGIGSERVFYQRGANVRPAAGVEVWVERVVPYFRRSDVRFSSHFQTPPDRPDPDYPAAVGNDRLACFADPVFAEYRQSGSVFVRRTLELAIEKLIGPPPVGRGLPPSVLCVPRRRGADLLVTLLRYLPVRKSLDIDVVEEGQSFAGETLRFAGDVRTVHCVTTGRPLARATGGGFALPDARGRLLLEVKGYFGGAAGA
jgi:hypothetical protein